MASEKRMVCALQEGSFPNLDSFIYPKSVCGSTDLSLIHTVACDFLEANAEIGRKIGCAINQDYLGDIQCFAGDVLIEVHVGHSDSMMHLATLIRDCAFNGVELELHYHLADGSTVDQLMRW